jgi:Xaa-Pro aminopeptidase
MVKRLCFLMLVSLMFNVYSQEHQSHFPPEEFKARWEKVFDRIGESVAIIQGAPDNGGFIYPRQTNSFYYLCGVANFNAYLVLDGKNRQVTLYLPEDRRKSDARVLSLKDTARVKLRTGVDRVLDTESLEIPNSKVIYTPFSPSENQGQSRWELLNANRKTASDRWDGRISREQHFVGLLRARFPRTEIEDLNPILDTLRTIKSAREIELIRRASKLAALGIKEAMHSTSPGVYEYQLDAAARYVFQVNGAKLEGYRSITASGVKNISDGHYYFNSSRLRKGDLVLMDYAPDYGCYVSDIGRMWPVNGKFNPWQRELCGFILTYHKAILKRIRPGVTPANIMDEAKAEMEPILNQTSFSKPAYEKAVRKMVETGGGVFSHMVGMAVHDVGRYYSEPLRPGLVFAVDPQLRVPDENLYMRIEDTVVVTEDGMENLTRFAPSELNEIEKIIGKKGMVQKYPSVLQPLVVF